MPLYGRFTPGGERYGGGTPALETILESLNRARGTAYNVDADGIVYAENEAIARMVWCAWEAAQRFANQFVPEKMTDFLPRWERIFSIVSKPTDSDEARRDRIVDRFLRIGAVPTQQWLEDQISELLGSVYAAYETISLANARQWVPNTTPAWPAGPPPATRLTYSAAPDPSWYSSTAFLLIQVTRPYGMSVGDFVDQVAQINPLLGDMLPAWVKWGWYISSGFTSPAGVGFYLDDPLNLDFEAFD